MRACVRAFVPEPGVVDDECVRINCFRFIRAYVGCEDMSNHDI